ncbi:MAG: hypothetical protein IK087_12845 [Lachnospiraceae bacterium]|nr:hypothetical protein [Lachnospiraceae bacterium]
MPENCIVPSGTEAESLRIEIMRLRSEVLDLTAERDRLKYRVCPAILADYNRRIGQLELEIMEAVLRVRKLRRMIEVLQAARNRGEDPDYEEAVRTADSEYRAYEQEVHEKAEEYRNASAGRSCGQAASDEEDTENGEEEDLQGADRYDREDKEELGALYRRIMKELHPDVNPDITQGELDLLHQAMEAYRNGDLETLRKIAAILDGRSIEDKVIEEVDQLRRIRDDLAFLKESLLAEIEDIKTSFPYTLKDFLNNKEAVRKKQEELRETLARWQEQEKVLQERLDQLHTAGSV